MVASWMAVASHDVILGFLYLPILHQVFSKNSIIDNVLTYKLVKKISTKQFLLDKYLYLHEKVVH
jgi:hypothetical protein